MDKIAENINEELNNEIWELTKAEKKEIKKEVKEILKEKEKKIGSPIKTQLSKEEKIVNFFDHIEFLSLWDKEKEDVAKKLKETSSWDKLYWIEIFLSSSIATLWLLQNSVAVIIWAMLIAPLLRPINWLSFSIARWWQKFFSQTFKVLFYSIFLSILMWYLITKILWLDIETSEIIARTNPNVIDFFIAIFSAMIAVMSLRFTRLWESIAWVAMAASLMPPLAVIWIELALWNYNASFWASMLFLANLIAILLIATIFFWLYWFSPHDSRLQTKVFKRTAIVSFLVILILIPLFLSFNTIKTNNFISKELKIDLSSIIGTNLSNFEISEISINKNTKEKIYVKIVLKIPEWYNMDKVLNDIYNTLWKEFNKPLSLDIEIIRTINISTDL